MSLIYDSVRDTAKLYPENIAIEKENGEKTSYKQLIETTNNIISKIRVLNIQSGARIVVLSEQNDLLIPLYLAANAIGLTLVFLSDLAEATIFEYNRLVADASPGLIILGDKHSDKKNEVDLNIPVRLLKDLALNEESRQCENKICPSDLYLQVYTSGTTGKPKGVCLTEENIYYQAQNIATYMEIREGDRALLTTYLFNMTGIPLSAAVLLVGATLVMRSNTNMSLSAELAIKSITQLMLEPLALAALIDELANRSIALPDLKLIAYGSAPTPQSVIKRAQEVLNIRWLQGYGLTETAGPIVWLTPEQHKAGQNTLGKPADESYIRIVDKLGQELGSNEIGEIQVKGNLLMLGYWDEKNHSVRSSLTKDGWFATGDLGLIDKDNTLQLKGRLKEIIQLSNGIAIYPREIEDCVLALDTIKEAALVGAIFDPAIGEQAILVINPIVNITLDSISEFIKSKLSPTKWPHYIYIEKGSLPRNRQRKLLKSAIQKQVLQNKYQGLISFT